MNKILLFLAGLSAGLILGFSIAAWALYEPIPVGPAKYGFHPSPGPVAPYTMDGTKKLFRIECISESSKDCPPAVAILAPSTLWLMLLGVGGIAAHKKAALRRPLNFSPDVEVTISDYLHITPS
jgi:hypothetical protein